MKLLIDVGNTRLKWAWVEDGEIVEGGAAMHDDNPADILAQADLDEPDSIAVASVAGPAHDIALTKVCAVRWQLKPAFARVAAERDGLRNGYAEPQRLGVDRWLAMLAAWARTRGPCIVADAGTALTVDVVDDRGQHLGGIIAAGLRTSEKAVLGATRFPVRQVPLVPHAGLGLDSEACVRQGAMLSALGALDRVATQLPPARRYIAGGDAPTLIPFLGASWEHRPMLVFEGLHVLSDPGS
ncbi:MAG: type III pantothenate kinase [Panacagrimonas sp.]